MTARILNSILLFLGVSLAAADSVKPASPPPKLDGPEEFAPPPPPPPRMGGARGGPEKFLERFPESERARLKQLFQENPHLFLKEIRKKFMEERKKEFDELLKLRARYLNAENDAARDAAKKELTAKMTERSRQNLKAAERRIRETEENLAQMHKRLEQFKQKFAEAKKNEESRIHSNVAEFLNPEKVPVMEMPHPKRHGGRKKGGPDSPVPLPPRR